MTEVTPERQALYALGRISRTVICPWRRNWNMAGSGLPGTGGRSRAGDDSHLPVPFRLLPIPRGLFVAFGASCLIPIVGLFIPGFCKGSNPEPDAGMLLLACGVGLASAWYGIRYFRAGVQVSGQKLTIRNDLRTYTVDAADIRAITLQPKRPTNKDWGPYWATRVELTNGKDIWIGNFDCGPAGRPPRPERVAIVEEVRPLLGLGDADFTAETR